MSFKRFIVFFTICCIVPVTKGQTRRIDSIRHLIGLAPSSAGKLEAMLAICEQRQSLNTDTFCLYASLANQLAGSLNNEKAIAWSEYYIASCLARRGELDSALKICDQLLKKIQYSDGNESLYVKISLQKGQAFIKSNKYKEALSEFYKLLAEAEEKHDTLAQVYTKTSMGWVNMEIGKNTEALSWFYKAIRTPGSDKFLRSYGVIYSNMAATYNEINRNDSAEFYINKAIAATRSNEDLQYLANALAIQADIFTDTKRNELAEKSLNEAVEIRKQIGDPYYVVSDITQLAIFYAGNQETEKGIAACQEGIAMARKFNLDAKLPILYNALADNYKAAGKYEEYGQTMEHILSLKDSLYEKNSVAALAEMQAGYDAQKRENIIARQNLDLQRKNYLFYGVLLLMFFGILLILILFNGFRKRQKLQMKMMLEKEKDMSILAVARAEEGERKRIAADLHDNLGAYAASIASNIDQLTNIADHDKLALNELRSNSKEMVSQLSDTIWALKKDALLLTAISDRLKIFIQRLQTSYPAIKMEVLENISNDHLLPPSQAFHLFQVVKESVINALKHSGCSEIIIVVEGDEHWNIIVNDDGKGIDLENLNTKSEGGNGIINMRTRAAECGWKIEWVKHVAAGTSVVVSSTTN
jgi:signal transduction histidine kinase